MISYGILHKKIRIIIALMGLTLFLTTIGAPPDCRSAERRPAKPEWVMPERYPEWFHGWGRIGYFEGNELVINDFDYRVSPSATFHTPTDHHASRHIFKVGQLVGFLFNEQDEIISVWLITMGK